MIPTIIHQVWVGPNPLPDQYFQWIDEIRKLHPDFTHIVWDDELVKKDFPELSFEGLHNWSECSDLMRWHLMVTHGGIYLDTDFELFKPLTPLIDCGGFFGLIHDPNPDNALTYPLSGLMGFEQGHPLAHTCLATYEDRRQQRAKGKLQDMNSGQMSGMLHTLWMDMDNHMEMFKDVRMLPHEYFYKHPEEDKIPNQYAVHHGGGAWFEGGVGYGEL